MNVCVSMCACDRLHMHVCVGVHVCILFVTGSVFLCVLHLFGWYVFVCIRILRICFEYNLCVCVCVGVVYVGFRCVYCVCCGEVCV